MPANSHPPAGAMRGAIDQFIGHLQRERGKSPNTVAAYRSDLAQFLTFARSRGHVSWHVPSTLIHAFMAYLVEREYQPSSQARKLAAVKALFRYLAVSGQIPNDPTGGMGGTRVIKRRRRIISTGEVERLLEQPANGRSPELLRDRAMLEAMYATGMRVSELVALSLTDVVPDGAKLVLSRHGARQRTVPLSERAWVALHAYLDDGRGKLLRNAVEAALFLNHQGNRLTRQGFWLIIKGHARRAGIATPITPHTLRHSFATHRLRAAGNVREVQQLLGHASVATTQIYMKLAREVPPEGDAASLERT
ncbi:MAG: tyrosine-type recombinase/integrase [Actinobacteria bacterium]|nr:tyrosine-type recombinase/integrase [Actinomycetota bacterium]